MPVHVLAPRDAFERGARPSALRVTDGQGFDQALRLRLLGPFAGAETGS